jgi:hypothetical protein
MRQKKDAIAPDVGTEQKTISTRLALLVTRLQESLSFLIAQVGITEKAITRKYSLSIPA